MEGYGDFKIKYSAELQFDLAHTDRIDVNFPFNEEDNDSMVAYKLASLNQEVIAETIQLIDFEQLHQIIELLDQTKISISMEQEIHYLQLCLSNIK